MKFFSALILFVVLFLTTVFVVNAQSPESIWIQTNTTDYKTGETVVATINAISDTLIQGFTTQIRYDPTCLQPVSGSSPIAGMNGLALPQASGLVDASFASTTPQMANGVLAEVRFTTLKGCQTNLIMESAALVVRNESGFAVPIPGVTISENNVALNIDKEVGVSQPTQMLDGSTLPLKPTIPSQNFVGLAIGLLAVLFVAGSGFILYKRLNVGKNAHPKTSKPSRVAAVHFKHGSYAGKSFKLNKSPILIGRDPMNDLCLKDPYVLGQHAKIFTANNAYYLMDLGGETFVNGHALQRNSAALRQGDVVRLGRSALFVFGS